MSDQPVQDDVRAQLESERQHLAEQLGEIAVETDDGASFDENFADSGQVAAEQGETRTLATSLREQLSEVDRALDRLDKGTYGMCVRCGQAIDAERLDAMPATPHCIGCA